MLVDEGVAGYFSRNANAATFAEINCLLEYIRLYVGGHIYPFMWLAEQLVPKIRDQGELADQVIIYFDSDLVCDQEDFKLMTDHILPPVGGTEIRPLLYRTWNANALYDLRRKGGCGNHDKVLVQLLFDSIIRIPVDWMLVLLGSNSSLRLHCHSSIGRHTLRSEVI
jgi:hypothetical protein